MAESDTLILGTRKGVLIFHRTAEGWKLGPKGHLGNPIPYAAVDPRNGALWASIDHGHWGQKLSRSDDHGETWKEIAAPKYPEGSIYWAGFPGAENRREVPATVLYLWVLQPGGADEPDTLYIGTEPGGLFRARDGESFELIEPLWNHPSREEQWFGGGRDNPGIHSVMVDPRDSKRIWIGISCAGVFETTDGGATWEVRNKGLTADFLPEPTAEVGHDPHFVAQCASHPDVMWMQNHCGIFRTEDGGKQWEFSTKGDFPHFGFAVAVDANDPKTAWVVPGQSDELRIAPAERVAVCRTQDAGKSWETLTNGLPQESSFDIVFRHALDASGDRVAFGSTTGNVYLSEDRGDTWQCLGNNIPPAHSFASPHPAGRA